MTAPDNTEIGGDSHDELAAISFLARHPVGACYLFQATTPHNFDQLLASEDPTSFSERRSLCRAMDLWRALMVGGHLSIEDGEALVFGQATLGATSIRHVLDRCPLSPKERYLATGLSEDDLLDGAQILAMLLESASVAPAPEANIGEPGDHLGTRILEQRAETAHALLRFDPLFVLTDGPARIARQQWLLGHRQKVAVVRAAHSDSVHLSSLYQTQSPDHLHVHWEVYSRYLSDKIPLEAVLELEPTLSLRTLEVDDNTHIKFGVPFRYGGGPRTLSPREILRSLYLSDLLRAREPIPGLTFFLASHGYYHRGFEDLGALYRSRPTGGTFAPVGCVIGRFHRQAHTEPPATVFERYRRFASRLVEDCGRIQEHAARYGVGLELHGQNLSVKLDADGEPTRDYQYRDMGGCALAMDIVDGYARDISRYYHQRYDFAPSRAPSDILEQQSWVTVRKFFLAFVTFNLQAFADEHEIPFDAYAWMAECLRATERFASYEPEA